MNLLSIRDKLVIYSSGIIFLVSITITAVSYLNERKESLNTYQDEADRVAKMIEAPITEYLIAKKIPELKSELHNLRVNPDIQDSLILDKQGNIVAELNPMNRMTNLPFFQ